MTAPATPALNNRVRNIVIVILAFIAAACLCGACVVVASGGYIGYQVGAIIPAEPTLSATQTAAKMDDIEAFVVATRGLTPTTPLALTFLTPDEMRQRTIDDFEKDTSPEEMADNARALAAFGMLDANTDLYNLLVQLYSDGIAGFYDPDTQEMVVISGGGFNAYERTVFAHEYTHALQDQNFGIRASGFSEEEFYADPERYNAVQALVEGDASVLEEQYLNTYGLLERGYYNKIVNDVSAIPAVYFDLPNFLLQDFTFPYREGKAFVQHFYDEGGWKRVDQVWANPPVSSEQIMHIDRYTSGDNPILLPRPALTDTLGSGWRQIDSSVNGEWFTYLILADGEDPAARLPDDQARTAAEGWGGDAYSVFYNDATDETALAAEWQWDTVADAAEFSAAFSEYGDQRFGKPHTPLGGGDCWQTAGAINCLYTTSTGTLWLAAPNQNTLDALKLLFPGYGLPTNP